jgi:hypothetical protein
MVQPAEIATHQANRVVCTACDSRFNTPLLKRGTPWFLFLARVERNHKCSNEESSNFGVTNDCILLNQPTGIYMNRSDVYKNQ